MNTWKIIEQDGHPVEYRARLNDCDPTRAMSYDAARRFVWERCQGDDQVIEVYLTRSVTLTGAELGRQITRDAAQDAGWLW